MRRIAITAAALMGLGVLAAPAEARTVSHRHSHVSQVSHKKSLKKHARHGGRQHKSARSHARLK